MILLAIKNGRLNTQFVMNPYQNKVMWDIWNKTDTNLLSPVDKGVEPLNNAMKFRIASYSFSSQQHYIDS